MNANVAIQVLPNVTDDAEVVRIVDEVLDYIKASGYKYYVGPSETSIEGDYEGIGHCILGYAVAPEPQAAPRKENRVYYIK